MAEQEVLNHPIYPGGFCLRCNRAGHTRATCTTPQDVVVSRRWSEIYPPGAPRTIARLERLAQYERERHHRITRQRIWDAITAEERVQEEHERTRWRIWNAVPDPRSFLAVPSIPDQATLSVQNDVIVPTVPDQANQALQSLDADLAVQSQPDQANEEPRQMIACIFDGCKDERTRQLDAVIHLAVHHSPPAFGSGENQEIDLESLMNDPYISFIYDEDGFFVLYAAIRNEEVIFILYTMKTGSGSNDSRVTLYRKPRYGFTPSVSRRGPAIAIGINVSESISDFHYLGIRLASIRSYVNVDGKLRVKVEVGVGGKVDADSEGKKDGGGGSD